MPEMPGITPWVPHVPDFPALPDEIPWPPDFDFEYDLSPWYDGNDGRPYCYNDFASRLMRLIRDVSAFRVASGLTAMYPPFDLRFMVANPTMVQIATLWLTTMWNTCLVQQEGNLTSISFYSSPLWLDPAPANDATLATATSTFYQSRYVSGSYPAQRVLAGQYVLGGMHAAGFMFPDCTIKSYERVVSAVLATTATRVSPAGAIDLDIACSNTECNPLGFQNAADMTAHLSGKTSSVGRMTGTYGNWQTAYTNLIDTTGSFNEMKAQSWWDDSGTPNRFALTISEHFGGTNTAALLVRAIENGNGGQTFTVGYYPMTLIETPPISPLSLTKLDCGLMGNWLRNVESVVFPFIRS